MDQSMNWSTNLSINQRRRISLKITCTRKQSDKPSIGHLQETNVQECKFYLRLEFSTTTNRLLTTWREITHQKDFWRKEHKNLHCYRNLYVIRSKLSAVFLYSSSSGSSNWISVPVALSWKKNRQRVCFVYVFFLKNKTNACQYCMIAEPRQMPLHLFQTATKNCREYVV